VLAVTRLRHCYPLNHRPSKVKDRKKYYSDLDFDLIRDWFSRRPEGLKKPIFHLDPGNETRYYRREYKDQIGKLIYFDVEDFHELREMVMEYLPEDLYYDRNLYKDQKACADCSRRGKGCMSCEEVLGQELMFDLDPENIVCPNCGTLEDRVKGASMFKFCYICFNKAIDQTEELYGWLESKGWNELSTVYSGRGFHIYVDGERALKMGFHERKKFAKEVKGRGFAIDPWVTEGEARLARVPYSLNGLVSRVCQPIKIKEIKKLDFWRSRPFIPNFL
jgi:DNA primase catalytic subunit